MASNNNPFTGRQADPATALETPGGYIFMDAEDGLAWGDCQFGPGVSADKVFESLYGFPRPDKYKEYLSGLKAPQGGHADGLEAGAAAAVLDDAQEDNQVVVTRTYALDYAAIAGFPNSVGVNTLENGGEKLVAQDRTGTARVPVNLGTLGAGASKPQAPPQTQGDTPETAAARAKSDATVPPKPGG